MMVTGVIRACASALTLAAMAVVPRRTMFALGDLLLALVGVEVHVQVQSGSQLPERAVYVHNHETYLDHVILCSALSRLGALREPPIFVARAKYLRFPVLSLIARRLGCVLVGGERPSAVDSVIATATSPGHTNRSVVIAPAGGGAVSEPGSFRTGAFVVSREIDAPVVPVALRYDPGLAWVPGESPVAWAWRVIREPHVLRCEVDVVGTAAHPCPETARRAIHARTGAPDPGRREAKANRLELVTIQSFLLAALHVPSTAVARGVLASWAMGVAYHALPNVRALRIVDTCANLAMAAYFLATRGSRAAWVAAATAAAGYLNPRAPHGPCVHLPAAAGFLAMK